MANHGRRALHFCLIQSALIAFLTAHGFCEGANASEASAIYIKKATWHETLIASREALTRREKVAGLGAPLPDFGRSDFTIMAWIKTESDGTIVARSPAKGAWKPQGKTLFIRGGRVCYDIGWVGVVTSNGRVADGKWRHVALAKGDGLKIYIDGRLDRRGSLNGGPDVPGHVVKIGYTSTNFPQSHGFKGQLDEVRIYNRELSANEIKAYFGRSSASQKDDPVGYWPFDDDGMDASGNHNDAVEMIKPHFVNGKTGKALQLDGSGYMVIVDSAESNVRKTLWELIERDFQDRASREQMAWEREDRIWERDWQPGDMKELSKRYDRASHRVKAIAEQIGELTPSVKDQVGLSKVRELYYQSRRYDLLMGLLRQYNIEGLRRAIVYLREKYEEDYPQANAFLTRLDTIEERVTKCKPQDVGDEMLKRVGREIKQIKRDALIADNPLLSSDKLLFVKRATYQSSHYYTDYIDGCVHYGGNLCVLSLADGRVTELVPAFRRGIFGRFDLSFDGKRLVFDYKAAPEKGFRIHEVGVDGKGLRQLTFDPPDEKARIKKYDNSYLGGTGRIYYHQTDDMHPCYLPDGGICFISTRCERGILCDGPDILTTTLLYRMDSDGGNIRLLSQGPVSEEVPTVMNDGRILYTRWEYVDKGGSAVKCLWAMRPDGSESVEIFGNDHAFPSFYNGRAVPGNNSSFVAIGGPHMPLGVGTVILLDINYPRRTREPMTYITPDIDIQSEWGYRHKSGERWVADQKGPLFDDPYPLSDKFFLVSYNPDKDVHDTSAYGLYLLDAFGNKTLIFDDPEMSCWEPMPLLTRQKPPVIPSMSEQQTAVRSKATVLMTNVYEGLEGVPRGTIKYIRVMETVPRPWAARRFWRGDQHGQQHAVVSLWTHTHVKVLHGIVPVAEDGSAYFTVPADRNIFFQALDEDFMEVQRMRTFVNFRPGERRSCIGCHEMRRKIPENKFISALMSPPVAPRPQPGEAAPRTIYYPTDVQPVLDKHCVKCHGGADKAKPDLTGEMTTLFSRSYENILNEGLVKVVSEIRFKMGNVDYTPPYTWGSHASKLITLIREGHYDAKLKREEFIKLVTWVDANAPYYGSYYGRRNLKYKEHPNFRPVPTYAQASSAVAPLPDEQR